MATGSRSTKQVQQPGAAQAKGTDQTTETQDTSTTAATGNGGDASQSGAASQAGAMGHPDLANTGGGTAGNGETAGAGQTEETVTIRKDTLELLLARVEALEGAAQNKIASGGQVVKARLPDQDDIDPKKITQPQLSQQGWVLPYAQPVNPLAKV
jgi:hypothetical protein